MSSRSTLILGALCLVAVVAVAAWSVRREPQATSSGAVPEVRTSEGSPTAGSTRLSSLPKDPASPASEREVPAPKPPEEPVAAAESKPDPAPPVEVIPSEPPKPSSLEPILGGQDMIRGHYASSTYEERATRVATLESVLGTGEPEDKTQAESYAALKEELIWLREHLGTPPPTPK